MALKPLINFCVTAFRIDPQNGVGNPKELTTLIIAVLTAPFRIDPQNGVGNNALLFFRSIKLCTTFRIDPQNGVGN